MSLSRLFAILLATLGLAALPAASLAQEEPIDDGIGLIEEETLDEDMWCDDTVAGDEEFSFEDDGTELRQFDEEFIDEEDPDFLGPDGEEPLDDEPSDEDLLDDCETLADDSEDLDEIGEIGKPDVTDIVKRGVVTARIRVTGRAVIDSVLTKGSGKGRASAAKRVVLGKAHQKIAKAGRATITVKLTKKGRRIVRKAGGDLPLTLTAKVKPAKGKRVTRILHFTA